MEYGVCRQAETTTLVVVIIYYLLEIIKDETKLNINYQQGYFSKIRARVKT